VSRKAVLRRTGAEVEVGERPRRRFGANALALIAVLIGLVGTSASAFAAGPKPDPPRVKAVPPAVQQRESVVQLATARRLAASSEPEPSFGRSKSVPFVPVLVFTAIGALLIFGLGFVPSTAVPRSRMSAVLEEHHGHFTLLGGVVLLSVAVFCALTFLTE